MAGLVPAICFSARMALSPDNEICNHRHNSFGNEST
jgi:hypothetical protein